MLLHRQVAVVYGAGGAIGSAISRAFANEGARVFLAGRRRAPLESLASEIRAQGGQAECHEVDALDAAQLHAHAQAIAAQAGGVDIAFNATGFAHVQGTPFLELQVDDFMQPVDRYLRSNFLIAQAVVPEMAKRKSGVVLTLSTPGARMAGVGHLGNGVGSAATEWFSRLLAAELAASGVRVVCLRPHALPESLAQGSHVREAFARNAARAEMRTDEWLEACAAGTFTGKLPTLEQVAQTAVFMASRHAGAITGTVVNLTSGAVAD